MRVVEPGNANTFGGLHDQQQNDAQSFAAQNLAAPPNAEIAKSTTFARLTGLGMALVATITQNLMRMATVA